MTRWIDPDSYPLERLQEQYNRITKTSLTSLTGVQRMQHLNHSMQKSKRLEESSGGGKIKPFSCLD
jgi:hypothetical protein